MANTYTSLYYHIIFSTKNRIRHISQALEQRVWAYIGGIARAHNMTALQIGGVDDHIHALIGGSSNAIAQPDCSVPQGRLLEVDSHGIPSLARLWLARR